MIKAIETIYNGYRFRSRLEARWAVFFDTLGIEYKYEYQDYGSGKDRYLCDFWLPELDCWIEIKPLPPNEANDDVRKCMKLSEITNKRVLLLHGDPWPDKYHIAVYEGNELTWCFMHFASCRKCDTEIWLCNYDTGATVLNNDPTCHGGSYPLEDSEQLIEAYTAARQARFEHGKKPKQQDDVWPLVTTSDGSKVYMHPRMYRGLIHHTQSEQGEP